MYKLQTPVKKSNGTRTPIINPSKVCISADGNLASKLAQLAGEAESMKQKMSEASTVAHRTNVFQKSSSSDLESPKPPSNTEERRYD